MVLPRGRGQVGLNFSLPVPFPVRFPYPILVGFHLFVLFYIAKYRTILHNFPLFLPLPTPLLPPPVHLPPFFRPPVPLHSLASQLAWKTMQRFFNPSSNFSNFRIFLIPKNLGGSLFYAISHVASSFCGPS